MIKKNVKKTLEQRISKLEKLTTKKKKFEAVEDWDFDTMLDQYGLEYLAEEIPDNAPIDMDDIDDFLTGKKPSDVIRMAFNGRRHGFPNDSFNPNDEWFVFDGYGNLESIPHLDKYLMEIISEAEFYNWCIDQNYADEY